MAADVHKYFDDSYSRGVTLRDGKPVLFWAQGRPFDASEEPALAREIEALTGHRVRFGVWEHLSDYNPREESCQVELFVDDAETGGMVGSS